MAVNVMAVRTAMLNWKAAQQKAAAEGKMTAAKILATTKPTAATAQVTMALNALDKRLAEYAESIEDAVDDALNADEAARLALVPKAVAAVQKVRAALLTDSILSEMEKHPSGTYKVRPALQKALDDVLAALR